MALRSVLDIDLDDSKFQRFLDQFNKYQEALKKQPELWKKISALHGEHADNFAHMAEIMGQVATLQKKSRDNIEGQEVHSRSIDRLWTSIGKNAKSFAGSIVDATKSLISWTGILGAVSGLLGAGGLFGIDRMAASVGRERVEAGGLNL